MGKLLGAFVFLLIHMFQASIVSADCIADLCGRWVGSTNVKSSDDQQQPFVEVEMVIEITDVETIGLNSQLFVGNVAFYTMSGSSVPFDLTGISFGPLMKASSVDTVMSAIVSRDKEEIKGYYLDTLLIPGKGASPQKGKFLLTKEKYGHKLDQHHQL